MRLQRAEEDGIVILVEDVSDAPLAALVVAGAREERVIFIFNKGNVALEVVPFVAGVAKGTGRSFRIEGASTEVMEALAPFLAHLPRQ